MDFTGRLRRLGEAAPADTVDGYLITNLTNVRYLTGFSGTNGQVLVTRQRSVFFTDPRYAARAATLVTGAEIVIYGDRLSEQLTSHVTPSMRLGIEADSVSVSTKKDLQERLPTAELVDTSKAVERLRRNKDPDEIARIREAVRLGDETFAWLLDRVRPGMEERSLALDVEVHMRTNGADAVSFEPIVATGELSAHIHHSPGQRVVQPGDFVLLDFGCRVDGYCSDLTRTVVVGSANDDQKQTYFSVLQAQRAGIGACVGGTGGREVDAAAREVLERTPDGHTFGHGLGHGVGLDIHEAPRLHKTSDDTVMLGDVVTVEPGIYRPGWGGVRIEDCVAVTASGREVLGTAPKDHLIEL